MAKMDKHAKIEKINAEIARMEVEMELECGGIVGKLGSRYSHEGEQVLGFGVDTFSWTKKKTTASSALTVERRIDIFKTSVFDAALSKLKYRQLDPTAAHDTVADNAISQSSIVGFDTLNSLLSFKGKYVGSYDRPNIIYKFTLMSRSYFVIVFVDPVFVKYRIFKELDSKLASGGLPSITSIKEIEAWSGDGKKDYGEVVDIFVSRVARLHNTNDDKLIQGMDK